MPEAVSATKFLAFAINVAIIFVLNEHIRLANNLLKSIRRKLISAPT